MYLIHIQELLQVAILAGGPIGTPWYASSGASRKDVLTYVSINYSESSEDRNRIVSSNLYASNEYDYNSLGLGAGIVGLFNQKNTEFGVKAKAFFDQWKPIYPTELHEYGKYGSNFLNSGYFNNVNVLDQRVTIQVHITRQNLRNGRTLIEILIQHRLIFLKS